MSAIASKNTFQMGNLVWNKISVTVADNMTHREDMIIHDYIPVDLNRA
jgi:hypothetical protein